MATTTCLRFCIKRSIASLKLSTNHNIIRNQSYISADSIKDRSPYEELRVDIDIKSSKEKPMQVNAYGEERTIACVCDDMRFMTLKKGPPVQCNCGYWFQLIDANKFWLKDS